MNNDLISRSALLEKRCKLTGLVDEAGMKHAATAIPVAVVKTAPAIDAVEVVRCPECVHSRRFGGLENHTPYACRNLAGIYSWVDETDFCSKGERREDHA